MDHISFGELIAAAGVPETTARRYLDSFAEYIPAIKQGRTKKYSREAIKALQDIARGYEQKQTIAQIKSTLATRYRQTIDVDPLPLQSSTISTTPPPLEIIMQQHAQMAESMQQMAQALQIIAQQQDRIGKLELELESLKRGSLDHNHRKWWKLWRR